MTRPTTYEWLNIRKIKKSRFHHHLYLESYGVKIRVSSNHTAAIEAIAESLPEILAYSYVLTPPTGSDHEFYYVWNPTGRDSLYKENAMVGVRRERRELLDRLGAYIRLTVAEFAVNWVFVHAGVVSWNGKAILMPAKTFSGKSTLTSELVRLGALYYSDEYAVFDKNGLVSPFPKMLSIRGIIDDKQQLDYPAEAFGGVVGTEPVPVGMILITEYKANGKWRPRVLSRGDGSVELIKNALSIRLNPSFNISVFDRATKNAVIIKSPRGEASETAQTILKYLEHESGNQQNALN